MAIEQFYGEKSAIARGSKLENVLQTLGKIDQLEEYVRRSILRFLQLPSDRYSITTGSRLDDLLFFKAH
jgi:hypothetical protein